MNLITFAITSMVCLFVFTSCQDTDIDGMLSDDHSTFSLADNTSGFGLSYPDQELLFGKTIEQWSTEWWKTMMSYDCANNPLNQQTLSMTVKQASAVVFLTGVTDGIALRTITVSRHNALFVPIINVLKEYSAAGGVQNSVPDQTIEQILKAEAHNYINLVTNIKADLDGRPMKIGSNSRVATDLFYFKGNKGLSNCTQHTVTGQLQVAVSDGYWLFLQNLSPGRHTLHTHAEILATGIVPDVYYNIIVR